MRHSELEREIVATSLRFSVLSRFTAFVAVDWRVANQQGWTRRVTQPVDARDGWGWFGERDTASAKSVGFAAPMAARMDWMEAESSRGPVLSAMAPMAAPPAPPRPSAAAPG